MIERCDQDVTWLDVTVHHFDRMNLRNSAHKLKYEPLLLHKREFRDAMQLLLQVVAYELADPEYRLILYIKYLIIWEDIRVLIQIEGLFDLVDFGLDPTELVIVYL